MEGASRPRVPDYAARPLQAALRRFFGKRVPAQDVEDLLQDLFVNLLSRRGSREIDDIRGYVFTAAANLVRKRAVAQRTAPDPLPERWEIETHITPERIALQRDSLRRVEHAIAQLPDRSRAIFLLHRFENMTYPTIAKGFGISTSAVEKHIIVALKAVRAAAER